MSACKEAMMAAGGAYPRSCPKCKFGPCQRRPTVAAGNVIQMPARQPVGALVGEWNIKMRMVFGGPMAFEFDLPPMAMTPNAVDDIVQAFRQAVEAANKGTA